VGVVARRSARTVGLLLLLPAVVGGALALGVAAIGSSASTGPTSRSNGFRAPSPKSVPIDPRACPYLEAVHVTAKPVGDASWQLLTGKGADQIHAGATLSAKLAAFDLALRVAATKVPTSVRLELDTVAASVERGQAALRTSANEQTFVDSSLAPLLDGVTAFGRAGAMVGTACGFRLSTDFVL
jgi:hypothetical protein